MPFSSELSGCGDNNEETLSGDDSDVPRWPYRFEAITKPTSPLRNVIETCNEEVFPVTGGN